MLDATGYAPGARDHTLLEKRDLIGEGATYDEAYGAALAQQPEGSLAMYILVDRD